MSILYIEAFLVLLDVSNKCFKGGTFHQREAGKDAQPLHKTKKAYLHCV